LCGAVLLPRWRLNPDAPISRGQSGAFGRMKRIYWASPTRYSPFMEKNFNSPKAPRSLASEFLSASAMNKCRKTGLIVSFLAAGALSLRAQTSSPTPASAASVPVTQPSSPLSTPGMEGPLAANPKPMSFDVPDLGKIYISGALTGLGFLEDHPFPGDRERVADVSNAQIFLQKVDGEIQFFMGGGLYSFPELGAGYATSPTETTDFYGPLPLAYIKFVPNSAFSIEAGKIPGIIGVEYPFTYENMNIFRGLLWNQEIPVTRGIQANYSSGSFSCSLSNNDGFYSDRYNWLSGMVTWTFNPSHSVSLIGSGNTGRTGYGSVAIPIVQNNDRQLDNLVYSYTSSGWLAQAYIQYAETNSGPYGGHSRSVSSWGAGLLANYAVPNTNVNLAGRAEFISSSGSNSDQSPNILYGPGSNAFSVTFTPTYQVGVFIARAEISFVKATSTAAGYAFGPYGNNSSQTRAALETGILF
jgi:Putative beta-barrel porin-2, OmpL-like. bbp2